jgi:ATP-binding cassette subfamily B protein
MSHMSFVFQMWCCFNDTIYNNIRIGNMTHRGRNHGGGRSACCDEFVSSCPKDIRPCSVKTEHAVGGRAAADLDRARFLKDGASSSWTRPRRPLDPENEVLVQEAISRLIEG